MWSAGGGFPSVLRFLLLLFLSINAEPAHLKRPFNNSIPAVLVFGDSTVDPGNNNYVKTPFKSNFPPYGRDFVNGVPTGRFSDGRLVTDFMGNNVCGDQRVRATLSGPKPNPLRTSSPEFPLLRRGVISVQRQLEYFKEYKAKLEAGIGKERTKTLISKAAFLVSAGTNDIVLNYFATPFRRQTYDIAGYQEFLLQHVKQFIQGLREEGAKLIGLVGLPPIGCLPIVITVTSGEAVGGRPCNDGLSSIALDYNRKLQILLEAMQNSSPGIIYYADIYKPVNDIIQRPSRYGEFSSFTDHRVFRAD
ncbi:GDSL esterase/lipase [Sesamum alatum]|uniref:GDSL esterase/lipase n=1 Tax=Sesamum alatum TaxID=300844 RepID=A0AAE1Y0W0_9LAMI|nr:GDSL esterase/lipase [Sesamum alatum]